MRDYPQEAGDKEPESSRKERRESERRLGDKSDRSGREKERHKEKEKRRSTSRSRSRSRSPKKYCVPHY